MSKEANKTVIGFFVVGSIALGVIAIIVLGSGKFFKETRTAVCYFEGSVGGLNVGAPVVFRGVKIGSVKDVVLRADSSKMVFTIPVYIDLEPERIQVTGIRTEGRFLQNLKTLIDQGLRASLEMQSFVTGQMQVGLDFHPDKPAKFEKDLYDTHIPEIPTIPTPMQELAKKLKKLPIEQIFDKLSAALDGINKVVVSPDIPEAVRSVNLALGDIRRFVKNADGQIGPLASNANETLQEARNLVQNLDDKVAELASNIDGALKDVRGFVQNTDAKVAGLAANVDGAVNDVRGFVKNVDHRVGPLTVSIEGTLKSLNATLVVAQKAIEKIEGMAGEGSPVVYEMNRTLEEVHALARSIRVLADHLERRPESVIRGK